MWPVVVVVNSPVFDQHLGLGEAGEQLDGPELVADAAAEALDVWVLPRRSGRLGPQPLGRDGRGAEPLALAPPPQHAEAFLAPQPLRALTVQLPPLIKQQLMRAAIPPPRPAPGDPAQLSPQRGIVTGRDRLVTLGRAMLTDISARPPLRHTEAVLQHPDRLAPTRRAHQFPFDASFSAAI